MKFGKDVVIPTLLRQKSLNLLKHNANLDGRVSKIYIKRWGTTSEGKQYTHFRIVDLLPKLKKDVRLNGSYTLKEMVTSMTDLLKQYLDPTEQAKLGGFVPKLVMSFLGCKTQTSDYHIKTVG